MGLRCPGTIIDPELYSAIKGKKERKQENNLTNFGHGSVQVFIVANILQIFRNGIAVPILVLFEIHDCITGAGSSLCSL